MLGKIAGMVAIFNKASVPGVVLKDTAVEKIGLQAMDAMVHLVDQPDIDVY